MKKLFTLLFFSLGSTFCFAQLPDSTELNEKEEYEISNDWDLFDDAYSYINFDRDILTSSNLSFGFVGRNFSTSLSLNYRKNNLSKKFIKDYNIYINPFFGYYSASYGMVRDVSNRTQAFKLGMSSGFKGSYGLNSSYIDVRRAKWGTISYGGFINSNRYTGYGDFYQNTDSVVYYNPETTTDFNIMISLNKSFKFQKFELVPEIILFHTVYSIYKKDEFIPYVPQLNVDMYYGLTANYKISKKFILNLSCRGNYRYDKFEKYNLIFKEKPLMINLGTNLPF